MKRERFGGEEVYWKDSAEGSVTVKGTEGRVMAGFGLDPYINAPLRIDVRQRRVDLRANCQVGGYQLDMLGGQQ